MEFAKSETRAPHRTTHESSGWRIEYAIQPPRRPTRRAVVAFHGFARPLEDLFTVASDWPRDAHFLCIHLPHHGASGPLTPGDHPIPPATLLSILREILDREGLDTSSADLVGYSIGGRIALAMLVEAPDFWEHVVLMAPDGLVKNPFYRITVHTEFGRWAWFWMDRNAAKVLRWNDRLLSWGLISKHLHGFGIFHMETHEMRMMVWHGWRAHRDCWPSHLEIRQALRVRARLGDRWTTDFVFGLKDKIIPPGNASRMRRMTRGLGGVRFHEVLSGHGMLRPDVLIEMMRRIFPS